MPLSATAAAPASASSASLPVNEGGEGPAVTGTDVNMSLFQPSGQYGTLETRRQGWEN